MLAGLRALAVAQQRTGSLIEIQAVSALALDAAGADREAVAMLAEALALASRQGHVRVFADEGAPLGALLGRLVAAQRTEPPATQVPLDYLGRLVRAFSGDQDGRRAHRDPAVAWVPGLGEQLTVRELEVLGLLAAGRSNRRIAQELVVTLDTVKKHVSHVLDKLGAGNRTEAVARARQLGLLR